MEEAIFDMITNFAVTIKPILVKMVTNFFGQKCSILPDLVKPHFCSLNLFAVNDLGYKIKK